MDKLAEQPEPDNILWEAVVGRDRRFDGFLFYGVTTTRIYCKPTCPSRRPRRSNAVFFSSGDEAGAAGFRPCKRCCPDVTNPPHGDVARILKAIRYIESHETLNPTLRGLGEHVGLSPQHFQKLFKATLGISPKQYASAFRMTRFKAQVLAGDSITQAAYEVGFGSASRLYENSTVQLGMTPNRYKNRGNGLAIRYAGRETKLGYLLIAATEQGLCSVQLGDDDAALIAPLREEFAQATLSVDEPSLSVWLDVFEAYLNGNAHLPEFPLDIQATAFQARVWQALRRIPHGTTLSYSELAKVIDDPNATRAVASACARNPVALTIPCHRIVPRTGGFGGYRWDPARKKKLLEIERLG